MMCSWFILVEANTPLIYSDILRDLMYLTCMQNRDFCLQNTKRVDDSVTRCDCCLKTVLRNGTCFNVINFFFFEYCEL